MSWNGFTIPAVGAQSAQTAESETLGSRERISSFSTIRISFTPFSMPRASKASSAGREASEVQTTSEPIFWKSTPSSSQSGPMRAEPSTLSLAISVPGIASKPAWTMAEFALDVPQQTSSSASTTQAESESFASSRAMLQPLTPAPMTTTSYAFVAMLPPRLGYTWLYAVLAGRG